jgi:hypothetical protein
MNIARKSLAWTLIFSAVMWTACGKDEAKNKTKPTSNKSGTPAADLAKLDPAADGNVLPALQGIYLISASNAAGNIVKNLAVKIEIKNETSGTITAILECEKKNDRGSVTATYDFEATGKKINIKPTKETKTDITAVDSKSGFKRGECVVNLKTGVFDYIAGDKLEITQNGKAIPGSPFCRMIKSDDGGMMTDTACKETVKMRTKFELASSPAASDTKSDGTASGSGSSSTSGSGTTGSTGAGTTTSATPAKTAQQKISGPWAGLEWSKKEITDGDKNIKIGEIDTLNISSDTLNLDHTCLIDTKTYTASIKAKISITEKTIELAEDAQATAKEGDKEVCSINIPKGKIEYSIDEKDILTLKSEKFNGQFRQDSVRN